jgi:hypothetical protein
MSDKCPFCGAAKYDDPTIAYGKFKCGTLENDPLPRLSGCWQQWALNLQVIKENLTDELATLEARNEKLKRLMEAQKEAISYGMTFTKGITDALADLETPDETLPSAD